MNRWECGDTYEQNEQSSQSFDPFSFLWSWFSIHFFGPFDSRDGLWAGRFGRFRICARNRRVSRIGTAYAARRFHQYGHSNYSNHADSNSNTHPNSHSDGNADFHPNPDTHTDT